METAKILIVMPMKNGDPTQYTYQWAQKALQMTKDFGYNVKALEKEETSYDNVTKTIREFKPRLFASFSHGCPSSLQGQNECMITRKFNVDDLLDMQNCGIPEKMDTFKKMFNPLGDCTTVGGMCSLDDNICNPLCMNETNINELRGTIVFATACFSAKQLGTCAIKYGVESYTGFQDLLMFPVDSLNSQDMFGEIQLEFYKSLLLGKSVLQAEQDMETLENSLIKKYKTIKYISLPMVWNKVNRRVLGNKNASIY